MLKRTVVFFALALVFTYGGSLAQAQTWPLGAVAGGSYRAKPGDQNLSVPHIKLPKNFTITFPRDFGPVVWTAETFEFGENCTIDLSPSLPDYVGGGDLIAIRIPPQPDWGLEGGKGDDGSPGKPGPSGVSFTLRVTRIVPAGSLWIKTDGERGTNGSFGRPGGLGGGSRCKNLVQDGRDGGRGGNGGNGGPGGNGGNTAAVMIRAAHLLPHQIIKPVACQRECGKSTRPESANGDTGAIVIWGAPGCGGNGGPPGSGGRGGDEGPNRDCGPGIEDRKGGKPGEDAKPGKAGAKGSCNTSPPRGE